MPSSVLNHPEVSEYFISWRYEEPRCTLFFHDGAFWNLALIGAEKPNLVMVTALSPLITFYGRTIIGEKERVAESQLTAHGIINPVKRVVEHESEAVADTCLHYAHELLNIYLHNGIVTQVSWELPHDGPVPGMKAAR